MHFSQYCRLNITDALAVVNEHITTGKSFAWVLESRKDDNTACLSQVPKQI